MPCYRYSHTVNSDRFAAMRYSCVSAALASTEMNDRGNWKFVQIAGELCQNGN